MLSLAILVLLTISGVFGESCEGRCNAALDTSNQCQCNSVCSVFGDCCADYQAVCIGTCVGRCNSALDSSKLCQCNSACYRYDDCCVDYQTVCADGGGTGESCDLSCLATNLWNNDINRIQVWNYKMNYQGQTTTGSTSDAASNGLFTFLNEEEVFQKPTFQAFRALLDNYIASTSSTENLSTEEWREIDTFLDAILETEVMSLTYNFLKEQGLVTDATSFRNTLMELWFNLYSRSSSGPINSSGFEHVFVGERKSSSVSGFHSWIQFYLEEKTGNLDYKGWVSRAEPDILSARFTWNGLPKSKGSFFYGVSPEFDFAIYSVCALVKPNSLCSFKIGDNSVSIQTWDVNHKNGLQVATAYPAM